MKFHLNQLKDVRESELNRLCFPLTLCPLAKVIVIESGIK